MTKLTITPFGVPAGEFKTGSQPLGGDTALFDAARRTAATQNATAADAVNRPPGVLVGQNAGVAPMGEAAATSSQPYDYNRYSYSDPRMLQAFEQKERQHIQTLYTSIPGNTSV
ncbi:hypothetical protein [Salinarimonas soli]|uniref:Uncharacterized protein n=1 Tax=Salinarimonas soli TaxID=1638099 RepID=A0A5B2VFE8_9HYPH|nr:hypothetical protein [Salinarimonas soli]KAA2237348.1 hypothetical protein F0L46_10135 [Salinarimonas soli]